MSFQESFVRPFALVAVFLFLPDLAHACAVCGFGADESRGAYIGTTVFLSVLPLALIGATLFYVWRHHKRTHPALERGASEGVHLATVDRARPRRAS